MTKLPQNYPGGRYYYLTLAVLFVFGYFYNRYVEKLEAEGRERGKTSFLVVLGTLMTLIPIRILVGTREFWWTFFLFCASGFWMVVGSVMRYLEELNDVNQANKKLRKSIDKLMNRNAKRI